MDSPNIIRKCNFKSFTKTPKLILYLNILEWFINSFILEIALIIIIY